MTDRWGPIRQLAATARTTAQAVAATMEGIAGAEGRVLVEAALSAQGFSLAGCSPDDPLLHGCIATVDLDYGSVSYNADLPATQIVFAIAHELGHIVLGHGDPLQLCAADDVDEQHMTARLPFGPAAVETYNPRQQRELEANVFAIAFLLPVDELKARVLAGQSYRQIAAHFRVSPAAALNALTTTLLDPSGAPHAAPESNPPGDETSAEPDLDPSQLAAATVEAGPVLVNAGPGTGKTRTLVARVVHLLRDCAIPANRVLAVTFSNRATDEMRARLQRAVPEQAHQLTISTIHAFCLEHLRRFHAAAGLPAGFRVIDDVDAVLLLERHLNSLKLDAYLNLVFPEFALKDLVDAIARAKDELATPERYAALAAEALRRAEESGDEDELKDARKSAEVGRVYAIYERLLAERGFVDFGGLVMRLVQLLESRPDILAQVQVEYAHILVDEYQDMNRASARLLRLLAGEGRGLWVVGDLRQSIYQFRGAAPHNVTKFTQDFPGGLLLDLSVNYRSDPALVDLFSAAGEALALDGAPRADWQAARPPGPDPRVWLGKAADGDAEARGIAAEVRRRNDVGRPYREQAILVRTHGHAEAIVKALDDADVPALYVGDLFALREVRDLLALVAIVGEDDPGGLLRLAQIPDHGLSRDDVLRLIRAAREAEGGFLDALDLAAEAGLSGDAVSAAADLRAALSVVEAETDPWQLLARYIFGHGALMRRLLNDPRPVASQRRMAIGQLLAVARAFAAQAVTPPAESINPTPVTDPGAPSAADQDAGVKMGEGETGAVQDDKHVLRRFLGYVRRLVALGDNGVRTPLGGDDLDAIRVLTVHASKGLEFPVVYVPCVVQRRFPLQRQGDSAPPLDGLSDSGLTVKELHELGEKCLFFVAISRAREELVLSHAGKYGSTSYKATPFLDMLAPFFAATPLVTLPWPAATAPADGATPAGEPSPRTGPRLQIWDLELYVTCPRRYEYQKVLHMEERVERQGYKRFHDCVHKVLKQLRGVVPVDGGDEIEAIDGQGQPDTPQAPLEVLAHLWEIEGPRGHAFEPLYRAMAERLVAQFCDTRQQRPFAKPWRSYVDLPLGGAIVRVQLDDSELTADGTVRLIRRHTGEGKPNHRSDERLALLRAGVTQLLQGSAPVSIELEYVATGETQVVPHAGRYEQPRVDTLEAAVRGILSGHFPARPKKPDTCDTCPYWIICPA